MRWSDLIISVSDTKVIIVLSLVLLAVIIAAVLTYFEFRIKKKEEVVEKKTIEDLFITKIKNFINSKKPLNEKLDFLNKASKDFFHKEFKTNMSTDFSELSDHFMKLREQRISIFCKGMFNSYYLNGKFDEEKIQSLTKEFIEIFKYIGLKKTKEDNSDYLSEKKTEKIIFPHIMPNHKTSIHKPGMETHNKNESKKVREIIVREYTPEENWSKNFKDVTIKSKSKNDGKLSKKLQNAIALKQKEIKRRHLQKLKHAKEEELKIKEARKLKNKRKNNYLFHS